MGSSIAYHLARQGRNVLVIEERGSVASSPVASWASAGGVRRQGRHSAEALLASEAIARWPTLEQELESDVHYRQGGNLLVAESPAEAEELVLFVHHQQAMGFADVRLIDRQEIGQIAPGLNERVIAGSYSPADGQADPASTTRAFASAAQRFGATYQQGVRATALLTRGSRVVGVQTDSGTINAEHCVLSAGVWSDTLAASIGLRLPLRTHALQMLLSTPAQSSSLQPVLSAVSRMLSLKQLQDGSFLLGGGWSGDPDPERHSYTLRPASVRGNWQTACELLPEVGRQQIARSWCGLEAESIDDIPFIGQVPGRDGLTLALGFSGHGFALSPAIGRAVADQCVGKVVKELEGLSAGRIMQWSAEEIEAFIAEKS